MCAEYGYKYQDVLKFPAKHFWVLSRQINRIRAVRDLRQFRLFQSLFSDILSAFGGKKSDSGKKFVAAMEKEMGEIVKSRHNPDYVDEEGYARAMARLASLGG